VRVAYFVHDLSDAAVLRRVRMLRRGGAEPTVLGFRRTPEPPADIDGAPAFDLGRTFDGRLGRRALSVARQALAVPGLGRRLEGADVIMARSLEMLVPAALARALHRPRARLVYECLDIHRLMVSPGWPGRLLRAAERAALGACQLLVLSSDAYRRAYFEPHQDLGGALRTPTLLVENRLLEPDGGGADDGPPPRPPGPPWRIGWFGMLRCRRSFETLKALAAALPGVIEVVIAGRPSPREFPDFAAEAAAAPGVTFAGPYGAQDLERLYGQVHFAWAIDHFEEGANSAWLLPNRIYESGRYAAAPIALKGVETGRWLEERGLGLLVDDPARELPAILGRLSQDAYAALEARSRGAPRNWFTAGDRDCHDLVQALAGRKTPPVPEPITLRPAQSPSFRA
jgi:hypothetical protein